MRVTMRYFAAIRESTGLGSEVRELPEGTSAGELLALVAADFPIVERLRGSSLLMVNQEYVDYEHPLADGDEVALIPPVSGGAGDFRVVESPIDVAALAEAVAIPGAGAVVTFAGTVRDHARGRPVLRLEYEAYPAAAEKMLARIGDEIRARWNVAGVAITHRIGLLEVGETSVGIAVSSAHRGEAFDACRYAIDRIKEIVPIWKKEFYADGETWVGSEAEYQAAYGASTRARRGTNDLTPPGTADQ